MSYIEIEAVSRGVISWTLYHILFPREKEMVIDIAPDLQRRAIIVKYAPADVPLTALKYPDTIHISRTHCGVSEYKDPKSAIVSLTLLHNPALLRRMRALIVRGTTVVLGEASGYAYLKWAEIKGGAQHADDSG